MVDVEKMDEKTWEKYIKERCKELKAESKINEEYSDFLDEIYKPTKIGNATYYASDIVRLLDPQTYELGRIEFEEAEDERLREQEGEAEIMGILLDAYAQNSGTKKRGTK